MSWFNDFKKFALRGNLLDLAIGFTVGAAFGTIAKSLVNDIIMPPVGLLIGRSDFSDFFLVLKDGPALHGPYLTLAKAQAAGAVTVNYGLFVNNLLAFLLVALAMFVVIRLVVRAEAALESHFDDEPAAEEPPNKKCPFCRSIIPYRATRCPECTSFLNGDELQAAKSQPL
ncbi:MAG: large conductance mechanosensitive channel protein MscL, partial [Rhodocyclaceae bacterium]|nr:large conductance mechanosensitive channel protein MscL [Rhodocyclaceae bacterium]